MEQRSSMMSGSADDEFDWTQYDPPDALNKLPNITSETIIAVVQSSLQNIKNQIEAEKQRSLERDAAIKEEAEAEAAAAAADAEAAAAAADAEEAKGKGKAPENAPQNSTGLPQGWSDLAPASEKPKRSRFGIGRILRHVRGDSASKSESSNGISIIPLLTVPHGAVHPLGTMALPNGNGNGNDTPSAPTPFTQFVYKHLKPSAESMSDETVECVSCLDDIPKKEGIKTVCHYYCRDCFARLVWTAVGNEAQWPPKCCLNAIPFRTITKHVPRDLLEAYRAKAEEFRVPIESRLYCSEPDCGAWIRPEARHVATRTATCPRGHAICTMCRGAAHPTTGSGAGQCPQDRDQQLADRLAEEEGWRRCIKCAVLVEHKEACQHMTCRCGAEFCYVCGARWRSCACTMEQLAEIKDRAARRREERTAEEEAEARELTEALRLVEEFERGEAAKEAARREEARRRREERRAREERERARREEARRKELDARYEELGATLRRLEELQRMVLDYGHDREVETAGAAAADEAAALARAHDAERRALKAETEARLAEREMQLEREYRARAAWERGLEDEYEAVLRRFWGDKVGGPPRVAEALRAYMRRNDVREEAWRRWSAAEVEKTRYLLEEEAGIRAELMEAARLRLAERAVAERAETARRHRAEKRWFDLVVAERRRLLAEVELVERENGGESGEAESGSNASLYSSSSWGLMEDVEFPDDEDVAFPGAWRD